jgi:tetratricopeptide (TPR) repeat protein
VARAAGWWWAFRHVVILTERPAELHLDDQGRLHCPDGMAIRYPDGWGFHAWHGRRVPAWVVQSPTIEQITAESDTEVRRCAIEAIEVGDPERAIALHQQTLDESRRVLGEDHPDTLAARNNLACAYWEARDLERAIALFERVLDELRRVLGEDHLHTLTCRTSLANVYRMAGDLERAIPLYQQALDENRRVLGDAHKLTRDVIARLEECGERI